MSDSRYKNVTHCIFDMDGLLLDTEKLYTEAFQRICSQHGKTYTWEHKAPIMGFTMNDAARAVVETLELPLTPQQFQEQAQKIFKELFSTSKPLPGAERLLRHLKENDIPIALATSSGAESYALKTQHLQDLFDLFHHKVLGGSDSEVSKGKPSPDIFLVAASRFPDKADPATCLVFEDAPNGVQAAVAAGMQVVMVPDPNMPVNLTGNATLVLTSLEEFKPEQFGLPSFPN